MKTEDMISVVVPYYNKWPRTRYLIESINRQKQNEIMYEVIIVDDGSDIPLNMKITEIPVNFNLKIYRTENRGRSAARNFGVSKSKGKYIVFTDDDTILNPHYIEGHFRALKECKAPCFVHGAIYDLRYLTSIYNPETGERFKHVNKNNQNPGNKNFLLSFEKVFDRWGDFSKVQRLSRLEGLIQKVLKCRKYKDFQWIGCVGGNISIKRKDLLNVNGYDEKFILWGGEDFELGYRLQENGVTALYNENCFLYHMTHAHRNHETEMNVSADYFINKHKDIKIKYLYDFIKFKITAEEFICYATKK